VPAVERWHLPSVEATGKREPRVLFSTPECRAVVMDLQTGEALGEHSVRENAIIQVVTGSIAVDATGQDVQCGAGTLVTLAPGERRTVRALAPSRILLLLTPWPGQGHYQEGEDAHPERMPLHGRVPPIGA
jgi:quercetin dioxygenase-like cupin family protein